ncbi:MAG: alpha-L-fucosidase [Thermoprotei archaeon]|nr:alpha-L-fucosidase [Thermoprotei archaeon]
MAWWREAKFGMFIHWGLYAVPAGVWKGRCIPGIGEWIMYRARIPVKEYEELAKRFNPVKFNAKEWVRIAKEAGMRYIIITAKHHDGFCMFDTKYTDYNIVKATPFGRDPLKELAEACKEEGIKLGFYYSQTLDWHHPDGLGNDWDYDPAKKDFTRYLREYVKPQLKELLTNYAPVAVIWFDIGTPTPELARELKEWVRKLSPDTIISGRIGHGLGDYREMGDNQIPDHKIEGDWETPATLNDTWGYKSYDHNWKSPGRIIQTLVDIVSKGGNYLLNVGPTAEGEIPEPCVRILKDVGRWLKANGESIYGTTASPIETPPDAPYRCTAKPGKLYVHVLGWPWDGELRIFNVKNSMKIKRAYFLTDPNRGGLKFRWEGEDLIVDVPEKPLDPIDTVIVLES